MELGETVKRREKMACIFEKGDTCELATARLCLDV